jgi:hypothetical protein
MAHRATCSVNANTRTAQARRTVEHGRLVMADPEGNEFCVEP